jgi:hypothetical protein
LEQEPGKGTGVGSSSCERYPMVRAHSGRGEEGPKRVRERIGGRCLFEALPAAAAADIGGAGVALGGHVLQHLLQRPAAHPPLPPTSAAHTVAAAPAGGL